MDSSNPDTKRVFFAVLLFSKFKDKVTDILEQSKTIEYYTPHGISHIKGVEASIQYLVSFQNPEIDKDTNKVLKRPLELLLLGFCAWAHDLGMIREIAEKFKKSKNPPSKVVDNKEFRDNHDNASAFYTLEEIPNIMKMIKDEFRTVRKNKKEWGEKRQDLFKDEIAELLKEDTLGILDLAVSPDDRDKKINEFLSYIADEANFDYLEADALALAHTVNLIARYHRRSENIDSCPETRYLMGTEIRTKLLAAIFRLADALHIDRTRFSKENFDAFRSSPYFTEENRTHWIKSYIISSIRIDESHFTINIQADLPTDTTNDSQNDPIKISTSKIEEMLNFVVYDLQEDVLSVSRILLKHNFPALLGVTSDIHQIPEMGYTDDIKASLDNLLAAASPNTSQLIEIAIHGLHDRLKQSRKTFNTDFENKLKKFAEIQTRVIEQQLEKRPCHEGLWKVKDLLLRVSQLWANNADPKIKNAMNTLAAKMSGEGYSTIIWTLLESMYQVFVTQRNKVEEGSKAQDIVDLLKNYSNIILYGYSQQVINILRSFFSKPLDSGKKVVLHIMECRTKTLYTSTGQLIYLDAQRYAEKLKQELKHVEDITIEPDVAVGHIIKYNEKTAILLGSNAVYQNGTFVHSMGHLTIAAVAKATSLAGKADVIVVTDGMKIGDKTPVEPHHSHERNPKKWLTPNNNIISGLNKMGIRLHNWQEDHVPRDLIDKLIVLDTAKILDSISNSFLDDLKNQMFRQCEKYCESLECHLVAAMIANRQNEIIKKEIYKTTKQNDENLSNWYCAESYIAKKNGKSIAHNFSNSVFSWLDQEWTDNEKSAVKDLIYYISNPLKIDTNDWDS